MRETRSTILQTIKRQGSVTVHELASNLELSPVTIRHHLYGLMADDLIERVPLRRGVGRPQHGYSLTEQGLRQFPSRYHVLTAQLLSVLKTIRPPEEIEHILETIIRQTLEPPGDIDGLTPGQRLQQLALHLRQHGIPITVTRVEMNTQAYLEITCPFYYVSQHHPEVCSADQRVIKDILQLPMERTSCMLDGDKTCTFSIKLVEHSAAAESIETGSN